MAKSLAVYVGVCAIQTFPSHFASIADAYLNSETNGFTLRASFIHLILSCLLTAVFIYPARNHFSKAVDEPGMSKIWYSTVVLSSIFLIFNILAIPDSYSIIRDIKPLYLFPALEICAFALLVTIYVLFYRGAVIIIEHAQLERRSQLLEMQAHQFRELQEYMRQTQRLTESVSVNYCSNAALNALFSYYHEIADSMYIKTDWKIELPEPLTVSELDMAALFGNLMENAIAAIAEKYNGTAQVSNSENEFFVDIFLLI